MKDLKQLNTAVVIAFIVLLLYTYISFLGALYIFQRTDEPLQYALLAAILQIIVVSSLVLILCRVKGTRWKYLSIVGRIFFGLVILGVFVISGTAFTRFLDASAKQKDITEEIKSIKESAKNMKVEYRQYVNQRVAEYQTQLPKNSISYLKVQSLEHHLLPKSLEECETNRDNWLDDFGDMSVWNIRMPERLEMLSLTVDDWLDEYVKLSKFSYSNKVVPFEYNEFDEQLSLLTDELMPEPDEIFENLHVRWWVYLVAIIACFIMLLPYIITSKPTNTNTTETSRYLRWLYTLLNKESKVSNFLKRKDLLGKERIYYYE